VTDVLCAVATVLLLLWGQIARPTSARCAPGWWLPEGARDGVLRCRPVPLGREDDGAQPPGEIRMRVYCTGGSRPIFDASGVGVACQRAPLYL
jgi:hypothetical protein